MACVVITGTLEDLKAHFPANIQRKKIKSLQEGTSLADFYILGTLFKKHPLNRTVKHGSLMKIQLTEADETQNDKSKVLHVFLFGDYAEHCQLIDTGDIVCISHAVVEPYTGGTDKDDVYSCQLICRKDLSSAHVLVAQKGHDTGGTLAATSSHAPPSRQYNYTELANVKENTVVNVFGVVKFFKPPSKSRGTDYMMILSITDPSMAVDDKLNNKLKCLLFARSPDRLPKVKAVGDIVRIHRLKVVSFRDELQGQSGPGFAWLVYDGKKDASLVPETSASTYTLSQSDIKKIGDLREWFCDNEDKLDVKDIRPITLSDIESGAYFNITLQVVATCILEPGTAMLLRCWDGTKSKNAVFVLDTGDKNVCEDQDLLRKASGYLYDVCVFDDHFTTALTIKPGEFVKFYNLHAMLHKSDQPEPAPSVELCLHKGTSYGRCLTLVDSHSQDLRYIKQKMEEAVKVYDNDNGNQGSHPGNDSSNRGRDGGAQKLTLPPPEMAPSQTLSQMPSLQRDFSGLANTISIPGMSQESESMQFSMDLSQPSQSQTTTTAVVVRPGISGADTEDDSEKQMTPGKRKSTRSGDKVSSLTPKSGGKVPRQATRSGGKTSSPAKNKQKTPTRMQQFVTVVGDSRFKKLSVIENITKQSAPCRFRVNARVQDYQPKVTTIEELVRLHCPRCQNVPSVQDVVKGNLPNASRAAVEASSQVLLPGGTNTKSMFCCSSCLNQSPRKTRKQPGDHPRLVPLFMMQFILADDTGWLTAHLSGDEAVKFFGGISAEEALVNVDVQNHIKTYLERLCPVPGDVSQSPLVDCFLQSYTKCGSVCYLVFNTAMLDRAAP